MTGAERIRLVSIAAGVFMADNGGEAYIGVDNRTGDAWAEEFSNILDCIKWLNGEEVSDGET